MIALPELQRMLRGALLEAGPHPDFDACVIGGADAVTEALAIYRGTCTAALATALRLSYPIVQRLVGEDFFAATAQLFIVARPATCADLNAYGEGFADFLEGFVPAAALPYLPDVARLEWAVNRALHAPDVTPIAPAQLAAMEPSVLAQVRLAPHPSLTLLSLAYPADAIWRAVLSQDETAMATALEGGAVQLLVERGRTGVQVSRLDGAPWRLATALCASEPLAQAIAAEQSADVERWLGEHLALGRFCERSSA